MSVRGVDYRVRIWGPDNGPPLLMLHGARDNAATFQFLVDALQSTHRIIAPDWRGHGGSGWTPGSYWLSDFILDLDSMTSDLLPGMPVPIIAHSMGGNIASLFAALRPERLTKLVLLDSLGNRLHQNPVQMPEPLMRMLAEQDHADHFRQYADVAVLAHRLMRQNARLDSARALFLAEAAARPLLHGGVTWPHDPRFHQSYPTLHSVEEWGACWRRIAVPVLNLLSSDPRPNAPTAEDAAVRHRAAYFPDIQVLRVPDTGHNLHHDASALVARCIDDFLADNSAEAFVTNDVAMVYDTRKRA